MVVQPNKLIMHMLHDQSTKITNPFTLLFFLSFFLFWIRKVFHLDFMIKGNTLHIISKLDPGTYMTCYEVKSHPTTPQIINKFELSWQHYQLHGCSRLKHTIAISLVTILDMQIDWKPQKDTQSVKLWTIDYFLVCGKRMPGLDALYPHTWGKKKNKQSNQTNK